MGYRTPNIDRIGKEGAVFTDWYGQQSCTAGRAAFITGQSPIRTGLTKVGLPGAELGLGPNDPSVADVMKSFGYTTGQFGKNHLGDRNEHLPTVHGFDEFFGNLYHLNAEEEPENPDYPNDPSFRAKFGPRGVLKCKASDTDDPTVDPAFGKVGKQVIENTARWTPSAWRRSTRSFLRRRSTSSSARTARAAPWFCYFNSTRMHVFTHLKKESQGKTGLGIYPDGMVETDGHVGQLLKLLDDLGVTENTIVVYTTDNGAEVIHVARWRRHPVQGREGHELGGRVPRSLPDPLARRHRTGHHRQRRLRARGLHPDLRRRGWRARPGREAEEGGTLDEQVLQGPSRRREPASLLQGSGEGITARGLPLLERRRRPDGAPRRHLEGRFPGAGHEPNPETPLGVWQGQFTACACPCSTTCAPIRSRGALRAYTTATGRRTACSCSCRRRPSSRNGWRASRSFRRVPRRRALPSATQWRRSRRQRTRTDAASKELEPDLAGPLEPPRLGGCRGRRDPDHRERAAQAGHQQGDWKGRLLCFALPWGFFRPAKPKIWIVTNYEKIERLRGALVELIPLRFRRSGRAIKGLAIVACSCTFWTTTTSSSSRRSS